MADELPERFAEPALLILVSLAEGPKHGWAMMEDIETHTGVRIGPGTLYAALARLESWGLVAALPARERRRPYELTGEGARVLRERLDAMARLSALGLGRLVLP
jgi:DNA-binding PadR family transcriptional regulator